MQKLKEVSNLMTGMGRMIRRHDFSLDDLDLKWLELRMSHCQQIVTELLAKPSIIRQNRDLAFSPPKRSLALKRSTGRQTATS